jgi:phosphoribosylformylglycinamidine synthase
VVGVVEKLEHVTTQWFKDEGDAIILLGEIADTNDPLFGLGGSAYLQLIHGKKTGSPPRCDLEAAKTLHTTLLGLIQSGLIKSAHDCSEGGLAVALAESCVSQLVGRNTPRLIGAAIDLTTHPADSLSPSGGEGQGEGAAPAKTEAVTRLDALLFGETQSRVVITCKSLDAVKVVERARLMGVPANRIGTVGGDKLSIKAGVFSDTETSNTVSGDVQIVSPNRSEFSVALADLHDAWWNSIARAMG